MTQRQVLYFEKAYETKNIATAAEQLYVSRSVISRAIQELEEELGAALFERSKAGVSPTQAGELFHETMLQISGCYGAFTDRLRRMGEGSTHRTLRIGVTPTNNYTICPLLFWPLRAAYPDIRVTVHERYSESLLELLNAGTVDLIISPSAIPGYLTLPHQDLYKVQNMAGVAEDHPLASKSVLTVKDLAAQPLGFLGIPPSDMEQRFKHAFAGLNITPDVVLRTSAVNVLRELTVQGRILSILPSDMIASWAGVVGIPVDFLTRDSTHRVYWNRAIPLNSAAQDTIQFLKEHFSCMPDGTVNGR